MPAEESPTVIVLEKSKETIEAIDWAALGLPAFKVRHSRNRFSTEEERPCISIRWMGDRVREVDQEQSYLTDWEMEIAQDLTIEIDMDLAPEESDAEPPPEPEDTDPTGVSVLTRSGIAIVRAMKARESIISGFSSGVIYGGMDDDEEGTADEGRLVLALTVLYRVRTDDPGELLGTGVNAT